MAHTDRLWNQRLRVLIVDDDADNAHVLAVLLQLSGHDTEFAFDGAHALQMAREHAPDVAFLDLQMPRMDGYELARQLRECLARGRHRKLYRTEPIRLPNRYLPQPSALPG